MPVVEPVEQTKVTVRIILHIEDETSYERRLKRRFEKLGFDYRFSGVLSDVGGYQSGQVAIFIFDWMLPGCGGADHVAEAIRRVRAEHSAALLVILTNHTDDPEIEELIQEGTIPRRLVFSKRSLDDDVFVRAITGQAEADAQSISDTIREIQAGDYLYRLREPRSRQAIARHLGFDATTEHSSSDFDRLLHELFQALLHLPPHERIGTEQATWMRLTEVVDLDLYHADHPVSDTRVGRIAGRNRHNVVIDWFGAETVKYDFLDVPGVVAGAKPGATVSWTTRRLRNGKTINIDCTVGPPLLDEDVKLSSVRGIDDLPDADWPKRNE